MQPQPHDPNHPRIRRAIDELQGLVRLKFPNATFDVTCGEDPPGVYLTVTVNLDDPDDVLDVVATRLLAMEIDENLPIYVIPVRTPERVAQHLQHSTNWASA
jgi:hypothetical protein